MKQLLLQLLATFTQLVLRLRYRFKVRGYATLIDDDYKTRSGGTLFLCNHPALMDPVVAFSFLWPRFHPRPIAAEFVHSTWLIGSILSWMRGIAVPDFHVSSNILKAQRAERSFRRIVQGLKEGDNFIINPAGRLKLNGTEDLGGVSWVHRLLKEAPEANIVLVRIDGLWGSMFSRAVTGKTPPIVKTFIQGALILLKNGLFFTPKREISVEFAPSEEDFPREGSRMELNRYLEKWFNRYKNQEEINGEIHEKPQQVSYSFYKKELIDLKPGLVQDEHDSIELEKIPTSTKEAISAKLAEMTQQHPSAIHPEDDLAKTLGLDSLDGAELILFLNDRFGIRGVQPSDLTSVAKLMAIAAGQIDLHVEEEEEELLEKLTQRWQSTMNWKRLPPSPPKGKTIHEAFLHTCDRMGDAICCADRLSGVLTYRQMKMRVLLLAQVIRRLPGDRIGVMLPASTTVNAVILGTLLAGKTPVMINWTVGSKHLHSCIETSGVHLIITSQKFTDQLVGVDLTGIASLLLNLEDMVSEVTIFSKISAYFASYRKATAILEEWNAFFADPHLPAAILFTSGTESAPKGVPLTHRNILSNHRATFAVVNLGENDILYGMLPPFHSFGFTVTGLLPLLSGVRVVYTPNPTDGIRLARGIDRWGISILASAPTFLKGILQAASANQLSSVRLFVSGAEKAPQDLFDAISSLPCEESQHGSRELLEGYGITECSPVLTINRPNEEKMGVGRALPNVQIRVVHPQTHEVLPYGETGLILARGPSVFSGYLQPMSSNGKEIASPFIEQRGKKWYSTGDLGNLDARGRLTISGRLKRFVKVGGEMLSLGAMEEILNSFVLKKLSEEAPDEGHTKGPILAIHAVEKEGARPQLHLLACVNITLSEANEALIKGGMSNLARLSSVARIEHIPLTGTGKVAYKDLSAAFERAQQSEQQRAQQSEQQTEQK